jgi:hypothetical protein
VNPTGGKLMQFGHLQCSVCGKEDRPGITCLVCPEVGMGRYVLVNEDLGKFVEGPLCRQCALDLAQTPLLGWEARSAGGQKGIA